MHQGKRGALLLPLWLLRILSASTYSNHSVAITPVICYNFRESDRDVRLGFQKGSWRVQNLKTTAAALSLQALPGVRCGVRCRLPRPVVYRAAWREGPILRGGKLLSFRFFRWTT